MSRSRSNWMVMRVWPSVEADVIDDTPAMVENCRSIGPATDAAMVSGLAPGSVAVTSMVGKSTRGRAATDSRRYPKMPNTMSDAVMRVVITGRRMQSSERPMSGLCFAGSDGNSGSVGELELTIGHDRLPLLQSRCDGGLSVDRAFDLDLPDRHRVVLDDEHERAGLADLDRGRGNADAWLGAERERGVHQRARPKELVLVRHGRAHGHHAGRGIDGI